MASVIKGIFIDVNKSVEVYIKIENRKLGFELVYPKEKEQNVGFRNYVNNIRKMLKVEYHISNENKVVGIDVFLGRFKLGEISSYQLFGMVDNKSKYHGFYYLNSSEERILSQGNIQSIEEMGAPFERCETKKPLTDLHTHLSGALTADDLTLIAKKFNPHIPVEIIKKAGIDVSKYEKYLEVTEEKDFDGKPLEVSRLAFNNLSQEDIEKYKSKLSINVNAQETFGAMEECYSFRHPIVRLGDKSYGQDVSIEDLFTEQLRCLARHYQKTGIKYAELSISEICKTPDDFLIVIDRVMPKIEREFPDVALRFLGAIPRTLNRPELKLRNENLLKVASSPYVAGLDVMAHEVNKTKHFAEIIKDCLDYSREKKDPNFVIRVHAGESDMHYDNVKQFLKIINEYCEEYKTKPPVIRIGHGINGFDDETLALAVKLGVIVEINLSSNLALNNVDSVTQVLLKKYKKAGLKIVVATDGHGMYSTDSHQEVELAVAAGLTPDDIVEMMEQEREYINNAQSAYLKKKKSNRQEKINYLVELAENLNLKLTDAGINVEKFSALPKKEAAKQLFNLMITSKVGKINMIAEKEYEALLNSGILNLSSVNLSNLSEEQIDALIEKLPREYYFYNHSLDREKFKVLNDTAVAERLKTNRYLKNKILAFKKCMIGTANNRKIKVYNQADSIPTIQGKHPMCIVGYVGNQWGELDEEGKREIISETIEIVASLNPEEVMLVASTAKSGFNECLIEIVKRVNPKLQILGFTNEEQLKRISEDDIKWIRKNFHIIKIEEGNQFDYSTELADYLKNNGGRMVSFGDGSHLKDHIINLHNKNGNVHLYNGKFSGSSKVDFLRGNGYEFADSKDLLEQLEITGKLSQKQIDELADEFYLKMEEPIKFKEIMRGK